MVIKNVSFTDNYGNSSFDTFCNKINLIYSNENTKGKTTFVRLLLYSLGYQIPSMNGLDFKTVKTKIEFIEKGNSFVAIRDSYTLIRLSKNNEEYISFTIPGEHLQFLGSIFSFEKIDVLNNLLGFLYIDQEKGWTLLNRGTVIGRIKFSIEQLLASLKNISISDLLEEKKKLDYDKRKYNALLDLQALKTQAIEESQEIPNFEKNDLEIEYSNSLLKINLEIKELQNSIKKIDNAISNNEHFGNYIDTLGIRISVDGFEDGVLVTKDNIIGIKQDRKFLESRRILLSIDLQKKLNKKKEIEKKLFEEKSKKYINSVFEDSQNQFYSIDQNILDFDDINQEAVNSALEDTNKKLREVNNKIKERVKSDNPFIDKIYNYVFKFANDLHFDEKIDWKKDFIFTTDLKSLSGASLQKIVVAFKVAFLKVVEEAMDTKLFLIIDSPKAKELDEKNTNLLMSLIGNELCDNQVFIASIFDDFHYDKKIVLLNQAIEERER